jgi:hypothetical protein
MTMKESDSRTPYPKQDVELTLADGSTPSESTDGSGTLELQEFHPSR